MLIVKWQKKYFLFVLFYIVIYFLNAVNISFQNMSLVVHSIVFIPGETYTTFWPYPGCPKIDQTALTWKIIKVLVWKFAYTFPLRAAIRVWNLVMIGLSINEKVNGIETIMSYVSYVARLHFFENSHMVSIVLSFQNFIQ